MSEKRIVCKQCGQCCIIKKPNGKWYWCPYLIRYSSGRTRCSIYPHRIGAIIGINQTCHMRKMIKHNFPGCPYNKGDPLHPAYRGETVYRDGVE